MRAILAAGLFIGFVPVRASAAAYAYVSPVPGSDWVSPRNGIAIREGRAIQPGSVSLASLSVVGSHSGPHAGRLALSDDGRTVVFDPALPFAFGEVVTVRLQGGWRAVDGAELAPLEYSFTVADRDPIRSTVSEIDPFADRAQAGPIGGAPGVSTLAKASAAGLKTPCDSLPRNYPNISLMDTNDPAPGAIFISPFNYSFPYGHLVVLDNHGQPLFYRRTGSASFDFKLQPNGLLTYYDDVPLGTYWALNAAGAVVDSFRVGNGYYTNNHEFRLLPDGHALLMAYDGQHVPMDTIYPGGNPQAIVTGLIIQELDANKNVVFQWRSWDHFSILDMVDCFGTPTMATIDYAHGNSIDLDLDGNLIISSRHMNEITKINRQTGAVMWRMGRNARNNQFTFVNDPRGFAGQHDVQILPNGHLLVFDNGNCLTPAYSRVLEYDVDETNKIATLVWSYRNTPDIATGFMGSAQRLPGGGMFIGWGGNAPDPKATEIRADGQRTLSIGFANPFWFTYRAFKFPWSTGQFTATPAALDFGLVDAGHAPTIPVKLKNPTTQDVVISCVKSVRPFELGLDGPFLIPAGDSAVVDVTFQPDRAGDYEGSLYLKKVNDDELAAQSIEMKGSCRVTGLIVDDVADFEGDGVGLSAGKDISFTIRLPYPFPMDVTAHVATVDGTARVADGDYLPIVNQPVTIPAGEVVATVPVRVLSDAVTEGHETFGLSILDADHADISDGWGVATLLEDDATTDVETAGGLRFALYPSEPNPARGDAAIRFDLARPGPVRLEVFDVNGRVIERLVDAVRPAGRYREAWIPGARPGGVYFYRLTTPGFMETRKLVLMH